MAILFESFWNQIFISFTHKLNSLLMLIHGIIYWKVHFNSHFLLMWKNFVPEKCRRPNTYKINSTGSLYKQPNSRTTTRKREKEQFFFNFLLFICIKNYSEINLYGISHNKKKIKGGTIAIQRELYGKQVETSWHIKLQNYRV